MRFEGWHSVAGAARMAWFRGVAWCALNLSPTAAGGLTAAAWAVIAALLLRATTLAAPGNPLLARLTGLPKA